MALGAFARRAEYNDIIRPTLAETLDMTAHIPRISISGLRTLELFSLELQGLTVLIGENGSGKSSIVEAFELLRRLAAGQFLQEYNQIHGGDGLLLCQGSSEIRLSVDVVEASAWLARYDVAFSGSGVSSERLNLFDDEHAKEGFNLLNRDGRELVWHVEGSHSRRTDLSPAVAAIQMQGWGHPDDRVRRVSDAMRGIEVHLPFDTLANWASRSQGNRVSALRDSVTVSPTLQLERFGANLANAYLQLRNTSSSDQWEYTMELVRLGLGGWVESVNTRPDPSGGRIALWIKRYNIDQQIPAAALSDGQLAYLAFVALARLPSERSVLCFDEPDLHLHPRMLTHVLSLLEMIAERTPVLITTHSRRVLDELTDPADSVGVLELNPTTLRTELGRLDAGALADWLQDYEGLGRVLDAGYQESFLTRPPAKATES